MPNTKSESPYIFSTDEQLRQDLKKAMVERRYTANALARFFDVTPSKLGRFQTCLIDLAGRTGGLPPDVMSAITELNSFFSLAK